MKDGGHMKFCKDYIGSACIDGTCPIAREGEDGRRPAIKCNECWYYKGCEDCAAPYYKCCPEGKVDE